MFFKQIVYYCFVFNLILQALPVGPGEEFGVLAILKRKTRAPILFMFPLKSSIASPSGWAGSEVRGSAKKIIYLSIREGSAIFVDSPPGLRARPPVGGWQREAQKAKGGPLRFFLLYCPPSLEGLQYSHQKKSVQKQRGTPMFLVNNASPPSSSPPSTGKACSMKLEGVVEKMQRGGPYICFFADFTRRAFNIEAQFN